MQEGQQDTIIPIMLGRDYKIGALDSQYHVQAESQKNQWFKKERVSKCREALQTKWQMVGVDKRILLLPKGLCEPELF